jgi:cell division septation protein DedD
MRDGVQADGGMMDMGRLVMGRMAMVALAAVALGGAIAPAAAQGAGAAAVVERARRLVDEGQGAAGRILVDSLLSASQPGSPDHLDAMFWRARLAPTVADAERGYRALVMEYPLSARGADALLELARLEIARGDRDVATTRLQRFLRQNPDHPERARASLDLMRLLFDQNDLPRACGQLAETRTQLPADAVELRNQVDFYAPRCRDVVAVSPLSGGVTQAPVAVSPPPPAGAASATPPGTPPASTGTATGAATAPRPAATATAPTRQTTARGVQFALQVAAYSTRADADRLVARLKTQSVTARVVGTQRPFRVRIGTFASRADAERRQRELKARGIETIIVTMGAEER